jgi:thiamine pyrophosphokinase
MGHARITVIRTEATLLGAPGDLVSLLAAHGPARGVRTEGLRYPLAREDLHPGSTRGISNELLGAHAVVGLDAGVLLAVQPGTPEDP